MHRHFEDLVLKLKLRFAMVECMYRRSMEVVAVAFNRRSVEEVCTKAERRSAKSAKWSRLEASRSGRLSPDP